MLSIQVLNTKGAARRLGCSETGIHKLAATGKLKAYIYGDEGELIEQEKATRKPGRPLYFLADDVAQYRPAVQRRPRGVFNTHEPGSFLTKKMPEKRSQSLNIYAKKLPVS